MSSAVSKVTLNGDGVQTSWPFSFKVWKAADLEVSITNAAGVTTVVSNWSVSLADTGGTVTYPTSGPALPSGHKITIARSMDFLQDVDLVSGTRWDPEVVETALDRATAERQQLKEKLDRAIVVDIAATTTPEALLESIYAATAAGSLNTDASRINYLPAGTGAAARTVQDKLREVVSVKDFGILGDGTDESTKLQNALNHLRDAGGGELRFNGEVVRCDSPLIGYTNTKIVGTPGSTIDWSHRSAPETTGDGGLLVFRGTAGSEILLTADAEFKANKIFVPDASVFAEGDLVEVSINAEGSFPDTSVGVKSGQLAVVTGVYTNTNALVLDSPVMEPLGYTTVNGARVRKITPVENILIDGMTFKGVGRQYPTGSGDLGVRVFFGRNVTIRNCVFSRIDGKSVEVISCYHFLIDNNDVVHDKLGLNEDNVSYGIAFSTSMYGRISNNKCINARHGIVSSHLSAALDNDYFGVSRFILIDGNSVTGNYGDVGSSGWGLSHAGIATHCDLEHISIVNNFVTGCRFGINVRTFNVKISGNTLVDNPGTGIFLSGVFRDILIESNSITGGNTSITNSSDTFTTPHKNLKIINNVVTKAGSIAITASTTEASTGLVFSGNTVTDYAGSSTIGVIIFKGAFTGIINDNLVDNATIAAIRLDNTKGVMITGNHIYRTDRPINVLTTCSKTVITNNTFIDNNENISAPAASQSVVSGNHYFGSEAL
jgi:hypothetical protein